MIPLLVLVAAALGARVSGAVGWTGTVDWAAATRVGLAVMFLFTASAHFTRTRQDLITMVPPAVPLPGLMVTLTGILEAVGAVGLLMSGTARWAAVGLMLLLLLMFPANVHAARTDHTIEGRRHMPFIPRLLLQVAWIVLLWWCTRSVMV